MTSSSIISFWPLFLLIFITPSIIALIKKHPYKVPIILLNILGGLLWGLGWLASLIWCFITPKKQTLSVSDEISNLFALKEKGAITEDEFNTKKKELIQQ